MSTETLFYRALRVFGQVTFGIFSTPTILHADRLPREGAFLLAGNHSSPFDAALLIIVTPPVIHWLSIIELFQKWWSRWYLTAMLATPLDRSRPDTRTVRQIVRKLKRGCVVGVFPEGRLRHGNDSILGGGEIGDGISGLAQLAGVPIVPCVLIGADKFHRIGGWLPIPRTRYAVIYGEPIAPPAKRAPPEAVTAMSDAVCVAMRALDGELRNSCPNL